jgi:formamidopyrimidine-DNA glycosylase
MPELPEVETVKCGLLKLIVGKKFTSAKTDNPKSFQASKGDISAFLIGASIIDVRRRAKVLIIDLSTGYSLVGHLKMTGQLVYIGASDSISSERLHAGSEKGFGAFSDSGSRCSDEIDTLTPRFGAGHPNDSLVGILPDKSTRITFEFDDGSHLYFNDQRKFGWVKLMPTQLIPDLPFMQKVGPEPLDADFTVEQFKERFIKRARTNIKAAILDQSTIAGVGNIYADEALWGARLHPRRLVGSLSDIDYKNLYEQVRAVMFLSIEKGGSTNRNYVNAEGKKGSYMDFANIFRREGKPCNRCGNEIIKIRVAGRGTHVCEVCQINNY